MRMTSPLLVVRNQARSRMFYEQLLDQTVVMDVGENITLAPAGDAARPEAGGSFSLQTQTSWLEFIRRGPKDLVYGGNACELYFESEDLDAFLPRLYAYPDIELVHDVVEYPWGQRVVRFYDPDRHVIEVGESMASVMRKFLAQGMSPEQVAMRTQHPIEMVRACMESA